MKSRTIDIWETTVKNPPKDYKEYFDAETEFVLENITSESTILDIGSGSGRTIKELAKNCKKVIGIDNDPEAIDLSKEILKEVNNIELLIEDAEHTSFEDKSFDVVFIGLTFCNFADSKLTILSEIKRILKDEGKFIFSVFSENALPSREEAYKNYDGGYTIIDEEKGTVKFNKGGGISEQFSLDDIRKILDNSGFKIEQTSSGKMFHIFSCKKSEF